MVQLFDINEGNWSDVASLCISEEQQKFLDRPIGIIARGYAYRSSHARVFGISGDGQVVGIALVKDLEEAPACYDLQQFMIDGRFQNKGYGTEALRLILNLLFQEGRYGQVEVCVSKKNAAALRLYEKAGFEDTGYLDESAPDCRNLMYHFHKEHLLYSDAVLSDFSNPLFQKAFRQYFGELGFHIRDWDGLFREMNEEGGNSAFVRTSKEGEIIGFLQCKPVKFTSWFFEETCGFIREFWIRKEFRHQGHGTALLCLAEKYFTENGIYTSILTTDTAMGFYERHGYAKALGCKAKNQDEVFIKHLR